MKLVFLCVASALAVRDVDPPVISLTLPGYSNAYSGLHSVQTHRNTPNVTQNAENVLRHVHDASSESVTCEIGTSQADIDVCPKPTCQAYDHHQGSIACTTTYILVNNDGTPTTAQTPDSDIERGLRSEWLLKYDAQDLSGNKAQTVSFTMIFQDTRTPELETEFKTTNWEHNESHGQHGNGVESRLETNTFTVTNVDEHPWLQSCYGWSRAQEKSSFADQCKYALSRNVNATDAYDGDSVTTKVRARMCWRANETDAKTLGCEGKTAWETLSATVPAADDWTVDSHYTEDLRVYVVEYKACDNAGIFGYDEKDNCGVQRNVLKITDTVIPEIYRNDYNTTGDVSCAGLDTCTIECRKGNSWYVEPGAQCYDARASWSQAYDSGSDKAADVTYTLDSASNKEGATNAALNAKQANAGTRIGYALFPQCSDANPACADEDDTESASNQYVVHYNCNDGFVNNKANEKFRTLHVQDTEDPTIILPSPHVIENSAGSHVFNASHGFEVSAGLNMGYKTTGGLGDVGDARVVSCSDTCDNDVFITATLHEGLECEDQHIIAKGTAGEGRLLENWDDYKVGDYSIKYSCYDHFRRDLVAHHADVVPAMGTDPSEYMNNNTGRLSRVSTACRKIRNVDHTHPIIQILGSDEMTLEATQEGNYVDDGATCSDQVDGVISQHVEVSGDVVNLAKVGTYTVTYHCKDAAGNAAPHISRIVHVQHTTCPRCTVAGCGASVDGCSTTHEASFPYVDPGASCSDDIDGNLDPVVKSGAEPVAGQYCQWESCDSNTGGVDTETTGTYRITYRAKNSNGLWNDNEQDDGVTAAVSPKSCALHSDHHGPKRYYRTVVVKDTLIPQMRITYGTDEKVVALSTNTDEATAWTTADAATAATVSNVAKEIPYQNDTPDYAEQKFDAATQDPFSLMAEGTQGASSAWLLAAVGAAVAGIALLGMSQRRATTSVPV